MRPLLAWLPAALAAGVLSACAPGGAPVDPETAGGADLYALARCDSCHGRAREGTFLAPALGQLRPHWDAQTLAEYLRDPAPFLAADARLGAMSQRYTANMRAFAEFGPAERLRLAEWLLEP
ncbi:MAG: hypothetical protein CMJ84_14180 [Planctomycetes bacterium]|jgi:mono/diheme cytochrome c family protein|nr:hypothetical protein [Planctomycetota bacterium]MDP6408252.1 hypothetical protein [Planctomycetota bacterium]